MTNTAQNVSSDRFVAQICRAGEFSDLHTIWTKLETRVERPFFLSWPWIDTWLTQQAGDPWVIVVTDRQQQIVGLGFFCEAQEVRHRVLRARQLCLNSTGDGEKDAITIEFNSFICDGAHENEVWRTALTALQSSQAPRWDEIIIKGATEGLRKALEKVGLLQHLRAQAGSARVDLRQLRENGITGVDGFVSTLSKNTRSQVRRSIRLYEERGPVSVERASDRREAWSYLQEGAPHHSKRWEEKGGGKAFEREEYVSFHKALIDKYYECGVLEVIRIRAGDDPFAWIYNFVDRGHVYFYLGALVFEEDNRLKPGLVAHSFCVAEHLKGEAHTYDFMGGENRYKTSLGEPGPMIVSFALQRPRLAVRAEDGLRKLKNMLQR